MADFGERLRAVFADRGQLCLGIDPHPFLLEEWGFADNAAGVREFSLRAVDAAAATIGIIKPQVAFFERHGSSGYSVLEEVLSTARAAGLMVIADVKRGDVGSTVAAYGESWLSPGSPLEADAMTISAYQGVGSIRKPLELATRSGKGVFVLAATSNPEAVATQTAVVAVGEFAGLTVAGSIVSEVESHNAASLALSNSRPASLGAVGVVIGATVNLDDYGVERSTLGSTPILAPGFGEQGALLSELPRLYGAVSHNVIANVGRSILRVGAWEIAAELGRQSNQLREAMA